MDAPDHRRYCGESACLSSPDSHATNASRTSRKRQTGAALRDSLLRKISGSASRFAFSSRLLNLRTSSSSRLAGLRRRGPTGCCPVAFSVRKTLEKTQRRMRNHARTGHIEEPTHSPVLTFRYPTIEPERPGYVHPQVRLELGSLMDQRPVGNHTVTPWVAEEFPALFSAPSCSVVALEVERTFWEKATILHTEYHRPAGHQRPRPP